MSEVRFITEFHNLHGVTVAQKKKSLFQLFHNSHLNTNPALLDSVTAKLQPATHLERLFFIEFLMHFRRHSELMHEMFVIENELVIKKITKHRWFFQQCLLESPCEFIKTIVPTISYNLTLKLLKNITPLLNEEAADKIFDFLYENYGILVAITIIASCSTYKIKQILLNNSIQLKLKQLQQLFDKNPELVHIYLQEREKFEGNRTFMDFHPIFLYIACKNIDVYLELCQRYDFKTKLGKKVSKRIVMARREQILAHPKLYVKNLHPRCLIKLLGTDFPRIFLQLFPKKVEDCPGAETSRLLKYYPKPQQYNLLVTTYNQIFAKKLDDSPDLIDEYILKMIPDPTERERMAKRKQDTEKFLKFYRPDTCFQVIKEKINFAREPFERAYHVATLTECCVINRDYHALLEVAKFVNERFKNDNVIVLEFLFLQMLSSPDVDFTRFTEEHWNEIGKVTARMETGPKYSDTNTVIIFYKYMEYLLDREKPIKDVMRRFFKKHNFEQHHMSLLQKKYMERFFCEFVELAPDLVTPSNSIEVLDCELLAACSYLNNCSNLLRFPRLSQSLKTILEKKIQVREATMSSALQVLMCNQLTTQDIERLREDFWNCPQFATPFIIRWFVKNRPELIERNLIKFLVYGIKTPELINDRKLWYSLKSYSHLRIDVRSIEFLRSNFTVEKCTILSYLMPKEDFFKLLESHKASPLDLQIALLQGLKNVDSQDTSFLFILQFCTGDYAPFYLGPLYRMLLKIPKTRLGNCIAEMKSRDIPWLIKCAYNSVSMLFTTTEVLRCLKECQTDECVGISFKYFLRNPSEDAWQLFVSKIQAGNQIDQTTSRILATKRVPTGYKARHFETIWNIFQRTENKYTSNLLKNIQKETVLELQSEFLDKLTSKELFYRTEMNTVASIYFTESPTPTKVLFVSLQNYKASPQFSMKRINEFVMTLFSTYMQTEETNEALIEVLLTVFQKVFTIAEIFEEYIMINFMAFKKKSDLGLAITEFYNTVLTRFGETIVEIFAEVLKKILPFFCSSDEQLFELYFMLLNNQKSAAGALLVIHLLPNGADPEDAVSFKYYQRILEKLQDRDCITTQLYLNLYFQNREIVQGVSYYERYKKFCINTSSWICPGSRRVVGYHYY